MSILMFTKPLKTSQTFMFNTVHYLYIFSKFYSMFDHNHISMCSLYDFLKVKPIYI